LGAEDLKVFQLESEKPSLEEMAVEMKHILHQHLVSEHSHHHILFSISMNKMRNFGLSLRELLIYMFAG